MTMVQTICMIVYALIGLVVAYVAESRMEFKKADFSEYYEDAEQADYYEQKAAKSTRDLYMLFVFVFWPVYVVKKLFDNILDLFTKKID